jgi:hypothetical protein
MRHIVAPMMRDQVRIDAAKLVRRTDQRVQRLAGEIADIDEAELSKTQMEASRTGVLEVRASAADGGQFEVGAPDPCTGRRIVSPAELTNTISTPLRGSRSPVFGWRCFPLARTGKYAS